MFFPFLLLPFLFFRFRALFLGVRLKPVFPLATDVSIVAREPRDSSVPALFHMQSPKASTVGKEFGTPHFHTGMLQSQSDSENESVLGSENNFLGLGQIASASRGDVFGLEQLALAPAINALASGGSVLGLEGLALASRNNAFGLEGLALRSGGNVLGLEQLASRSEDLVLGSDELVLGSGELDQLPIARWLNASRNSGSFIDPPSPLSRSLLQPPPVSFLLSSRTNNDPGQPGSGSVSGAQKQPFYEPADFSMD